MPQIRKHIPYRNDIAPDEQIARDLCTLDLYVPEPSERSASGGCPLLVWFHGGALTGGSRHEADEVARRFAERGVAVANADYRLSPAVRYPVFLEDAARAVAWAVRWAATEGADNGVNPRAVFVGGHSAGGYLAAMLAMDARFLRGAGVPEGAIAGCLPISGQLVTHFTVREERGCPAGAMAVDDAAPLYYVRKDAPPLLLLVGDRDLPARREEAALFAAAMTDMAGNETTRLLVVADRDHGTVHEKLLTPGDPGGPAMLEFMGKWSPPDI